MFFFNDTATTEIYTLSLHDALPIFDLDSPVLLVDEHLARLAHPRQLPGAPHGLIFMRCMLEAYAARSESTMHRPAGLDRKSTRLNSRHANISHAVFCLKKNPGDA